MPIMTSTLALQNQHLNAKLTRDDQPTLAAHLSIPAFSSIHRQLHTSPTRFTYLNARLPMNPNVSTANGTNGKAAVKSRTVCERVCLRSINHACTGPGVKRCFPKLPADKPSCRVRTHTFQLHVPDSSFGAECEGHDHLAAAGFALRCWLGSSSADIMMGHVYGALLVAVLVLR